MVTCQLVFVILVTQLCFLLLYPFVLCDMSFWFMVTCLFGFYGDSVFCFYGNVFLGLFMVTCHVSNGFMMVTCI